MRVVELQLNEVQDLSMRNRENIVKNARNICDVGSRNSGADKPSYSAVVSNSPVSQRVKKADAVGGGTVVNGNICNLSCVRRQRHLPSFLVFTAISCIRVVSSRHGALGYWG